MDPVRLASGGYRTNRPVVAFLYELLRDHVQPGDLQGVVNRCPLNENYTLSNKWLGAYSEYIADRLIPKAGPSVLFEVRQGDNPKLTTSSLKDAMEFIWKVTVHDYKPLAPISIYVLEQGSNDEWVVTGRIDDDYSRRDGKEGS